MGLYDRLCRFEEPVISAHFFMAVIAEFKRGKLTQQQASELLNLTPSEQTEIVTLIQRVNNNSLTAVEIHDVLQLAEGHFAGYDTVALVKTRLGV